MDAQRLSAIILLSDIFMQECILFISAADIFIMSGCMFIMSEQRLFFIMAVFDIRLHDIIMFMSAADIFIADCEDIGVVDICAWAAPLVATEKAREAIRTLRGFIAGQSVK